MSESKTITHRYEFGGPGLFLLFLLMFAMKVLEIGQVAGWSWWVITSPLWGPVVIGLGLMALSLLLAVMAWLMVAVGEGMRKLQRR